MTVALKLVPVESSLCVWCLGVNGQHDPKCYVGLAIARQLAKAREADDENRR